MPPRIPKWPRVLLLGLLPFLVAAESAMIPATIRWRQDLPVTAKHWLDVCSDVDCKTVLLSGPVRGSSFHWVAPSQGIYHWRLRTSDLATNMSGMHVVDRGTLGAIAPNNEGLVVASWRDARFARSYLLRLTNARGREQLLSSARPKVMFLARVEPVVVEIIRDIGRRDEPFDRDVPSLRISVIESYGAVSIKPAASDRVTVEVPAEPAPADLQRLKLFVSAWGVGTATKLTYDGVEIDETARAPGVEIMARARPVAWLVGEAGGDGFEHEVDTTKVRRTHLHAAVGFNALAAASTRHRLDLSGAVAAVRMPLLPVEVDAGSGDDPDELLLDEEEATMLGGQLGYELAMQRFGWSVHGAYLVDTLGGNLTSGRLAFLRRFGKRGLFESAVLYRRLSRTRCADNVAVCEILGESKAEVTDTGLTLGLGLSLF